jgi:hypothetical protein
MGIRFAFNLQQDGTTKFEELMTVDTQDNLTPADTARRN